MNKAGWALKVVRKGCNEKESPIFFQFQVADLLRKEHARSVRIVKAEIKRVKMDQHVLREEEKMMMIGTLDRVLTALQRGRGGKG